MADLPLPDGEQLQYAIETAQSLLNAKKIVIIGVFENEVHTMHSAGFSSHLEMTLSLATAIHMNLLQHDAKVLAGEAGERARETAETLQRAN